MFDSSGKFEFAFCPPTDNVDKTLDEEYERVVYVFGKTADLRFEESVRVLAVHCF